MEKGRIIDKERLKALSWLIDFANLNLKELGAGDRAKLEVEADEYLFPKEELNQMWQFWWEEHAKQTASDPKALPPLTKPLFYAENPERGTEAYWAEIQNAHTAVQNNLRCFSTEHPDPYSRIVWPGEVMVGLVWGKDRNFNLQWLPIMGELHDYVRINLYRLLDGLPCSSVQMCPGCGRFFLNLSKRRKKFCSPRCMWRVHAEDRRQRDPEGYRASQREIMRKRYETKKKKKLGPNVKVARRPRKVS